MLTKTVDFGAPEAFGAHVFRVEIPPARTVPVRIIEDFGYRGLEGGRPSDEVRVLLSHAVWSAIAPVARREFNLRLKSAKAPTARWRTGPTLVDRLLGKELCVLAWAAETATPAQLPVIGSKWAALRPEERWWLFAMTVAEAGRAEDTGRGWRRALFHALSEGEHTPVAHPHRQGLSAPRRVVEEESVNLPLFQESR
ncbi:MAG: DUF3780 domain-containing protein [Caldilinea sp. CFX5]|nr:DUF3780 domain-containing protein [Caldilinea sp. CFX5]